MSGPRGFHQSSGDVSRGFHGRGSLGYDNQRGAMSDILGGGGGFQEPTAPAPRDRGENMATLLDYSMATSPTPAGGRRPAAAVTNPSPSAMGDIITGVGEMGVDDKLYGLSKKKLDPRYAGQGALAALRGEEAEAGMDDPFKHARARPKLHARDMGVAAPMPAGRVCQLGTCSLDENGKVSRRQYRLVAQRLATLCICERPITGKPLHPLGVVPLERRQPELAHVAAHRVGMLRVQPPAHNSARARTQAQHTRGLRRTHSLAALRESQRARTCERATPCSGGRR